MSHVFVRGTGVVSPAGWGLGAMRAALSARSELPTRELPRPGWVRPLRARSVPAPIPRPAFFMHPRLRRSSPISHYMVGAALEALGDDAESAAQPGVRLGVVACVMSGCVNYSRRFFDEVLRDPATASPLVFPETVFNAPSSHLAALLGTTAINYTVVGDPGVFPIGLAIAAEWIVEGLVDGCVVVGAEELDWLTADAFRLFTRRVVASEGAGALYLGREPRPGSPAIELTGVTDARLFRDALSRDAAARAVAQELLPGSRGSILCDGCQGVARLDRAESAAWRGWSGPRLSPKALLGEGLMAAAAWQCVAAVGALVDGGPSEALVSVVGCNAQASGCRFSVSDRSS